MNPEEAQDLMLHHLAALDIWQACWEQSAVVRVGSSVRGVEDEFVDVDILGFVPAAFYPTLYEGYRAAVEAGRIEVQNPNAFWYHEFPLVLLPGVKGHYQVHTFEEVEKPVQQWDDVTMWIHGQGIILHDPSGRYAQLQARSRTYPEAVWREKVRRHYLRAYDSAISASNPLRRGDRSTVTLLMVECVAHLLRVCCLLDRRPFPYDKWLYREAMQTRAGRDLQELFERFFEEIHSPQIAHIEPTSYERPGNRNADLEAYPLHMLWRRAKAYLDPLLPSRGQGQ
jgi:hypothetical protein